MFSRELLVQDIDKTLLTEAELVEQVSKVRVHMLLGKPVERCQIMLQGVKAILVADGTVIEYSNFELLELDTKADRKAHVRRYTTTTDYVWRTAKWLQVRTIYNINSLIPPFALLC